MTLRGNSALPAFGLGRGLAATEASRSGGARAGARMILCKVTAAFAWGRKAVEMLQRLPSADDDLFRDVGLNRSLIERPEYRLARRNP